MSRISEKQILSFLTHLYDTAKESDSEKWAAVYKHLAEILSSGPGSISLYLENKKQFHLFAPTVDPEFYRQYAEYFQFINPFHGNVVATAPGERFSRRKFMSDREFEKTEIFQEFYRKYDMFNLEYLALFNHFGVTGGVWFSRPESAANFGAKEIRTMDFLIPHLQRAFQIQIQLAEAQDKNGIMLEVLGRIPHAVFLLDGAGKVVFMNEKARQITDSKDGLEIDRYGILKARLPSETKKLRTVLQGVFEPDLNKGSVFGGALQFFRQSNSRPLSGIVAPFSKQDLFNVGTRDYALLFIADPEGGEKINERILADLFGLTRAEARLAALLAKGVSPVEACRLLNIKQNTMRTHLKRIFSKTETGRQSELVNLILNSPANLKM